MKYILFPDMSGYSTDRENVSEVSEIFFETGDLRDGVMYIGDTALIIKDARARIEKRRLDIGAHRVSIYRKNSKSCWSCSPIVYDGEYIYCEDEPVTGQVIELKRQILASRSKERELAHRISVLEEKILGYKLF